MPMGRGSAAPPGCPIASLMSRPPVMAEARVESGARRSAARPEAHADLSVLTPTLETRKREIRFDLNRQIRSLG
jgi:hypothetical protein